MFVCTSLFVCILLGCSPQDELVRHEWASAEAVGVRLSLSASSKKSTDHDSTGQWIEPPFLAADQTISGKTIALRFGDTQFVQKKSPIELVPTPEPDPLPKKNPVPAKKPVPAKNPVPTMSPVPKQDSTKAEMVPAPAGKPFAKEKLDGKGEQSPAMSSKSVPKPMEAAATGPEDFRTWEIPSVALVVTGRQHGYIEPCGCTGLDRQKGGVARRFTFMEQLRQSGWSLLPVDGGDQVRRFGRQAEIKLQQTTRALKQMKYTAVGFGPDDLRLGVGELLSVAAAGGDPETDIYLSSNVVLIDDSLMPKTKVVEKNGLKIGFTTALDPETMKAAVGDEIELRDIVQEVRKAQGKLAESDPNFSVLLYFGTEETAQELVQAVPGFDLVVAAGSYGEPTYLAEQVPNSETRMIVTGNKGMYAGLVGIYSGRPMKYARVPLTHEFSDAPEMRQLMKEYQDQLRSVGLEGLGLLPAIPHSSGQKFVGTAKCGECHTQALGIWKGTPHADATDHLVRPPKERSDIARHFDPECISCHVTGWNPQQYYPYASGYLSLEQSAHLTGSGCENCHGPGSGHAAAEADGSTVAAELRDQFRDSMKLPLEKAREKCMTCHDLDNSPDFHEEDAFEDIYWPEVEHYGID